MSELPRFWNVLINPIAFHGRQVFLWTKLSAQLQNHGFVFHEWYMNTPEKCNEIVKQLLIEKQKYFIVVGGDGTLNTVTNALCHAQTELSKTFLAVIPTGTGNDWVRTHKIPHRTKELEQLFLKGQFFKHDIGIIKHLDNGIDKTSYFLNMAGLAFDAEVILRVKRSKSYKYGGKFIYIKNLFLTLSTFKPLFCKMQFDNEYVNQNIFSIAVGICKYNGNGMMQVPMAIPDDGFLDVVYIEPMNFNEIITQLPKLFNGKHISYKKVHHKRVKTFSIEAESDLYLEAEGEIVGKGMFSISCINEQINVLVS